MIKRKLLAILILAIILLLPVTPAYPSEMDQTTETRTVEILFDAAGGSFPEGVELMAASGQPGALISFPSDPARADQIFVGWYTKRNGKSERVQPPVAVPDSDFSCYAKWIPKKDSDVYTVSVIWFDSVSDPQDFRYDYPFIEKNTSALYRLTLSSSDMTQATQGKTTLQKQVRLPKKNDRKSWAAYDTDRRQDYFMVNNGVTYTCSYRESGVRTGTWGDQNTYFNRVLLLRRTIEPNLLIRFVNAPVQQVELALTYQPVMKGVRMAKVSASVLPTGEETTFNLLKIFAKRTAELGYFALDETNYRLDYLGQNTYILEPGPLNGLTASVEGSAQDGWIVTYTGDSAAK